MNFKEFIEYGAASRSKATLRVNQYLFLSYRILREKGIEKSSAIKLYTDDDSMSIGIFITDEYDPNDKYFRRVTKEKSGICFSLIPILRFFDIAKQRVKHELILQEGALDNGNKILIVDLSKLKIT